MIFTVVIIVSFARTIYCTVVVSFREKFKLRISATEKCLT